MKRLGTTPTRSLDNFETAGLRKGDDLFLARTRDGYRLLGAIRSAKQCVKCHDGERGDLLGAFSYSLR
jgi:hypothetical protein